MDVDAFVERLAGSRIGRTFNQYADGDRAELLRSRLAAYLELRADAPLLLVGEAPGYRGARVSGIPFTSERQLSGRPPGEATATILQAALAEAGLAERVLLWNVVPTHPGTEWSNRRPTRREVEGGLPFARELGRGRRTLAIGRVAERALRAPYIRHPSHGGAAAFRDQLVRCVAGLVAQSHERVSRPAPSPAARPAQRPTSRGRSRPSPRELDPSS